MVILPPYRGLFLCRKEPWQEILLLFLHSRLPWRSDGMVRHIGGPTHRFSALQLTAIGLKIQPALRVAVRADNLPLNDPLRALPSSKLDGVP